MHRKALQNLSKQKIKRRYGNSSFLERLHVEINQSQFWPSDNDDVDYIDEDNEDDKDDDDICGKAEGVGANQRQSWFSVTARSCIEGSHKSPSSFQIVPTPNNPTIPEHC